MRRLSLLTFFTFCTFLSFLFHTQPVWAQLSRVEINARETLAESGVNYSYDKVEGILHFVLDPTDPANRAIVDIEYAPVNEEGMVAGIALHAAVALRFLDAGADGSSSRGG